MEEHLEVFDGIMAWVEAGKLNVSCYDQTSFKLGTDVI